MLVQASPQGAVPNRVDQPAPEKKETPVLTGLAAYVDRRWEEAKRAKVDIEKKMLEDLRQRNGEYDPDKLAKIRAFGGSEVYIMLTAVKCRAAESWIRDVVLVPGEKPWGMNPTPIPDLPQEVAMAIAMPIYQQGMAMGLPMEAMRFAFEQEVDGLRKRMVDEAKTRTKRMEGKIEDQMAEGGWDVALEDAIPDLVTFPACIIKGPVVRRERTLKWNGATVDTTDDLLERFYRVSPFDLYPGPQTTEINNGYLFERLQLHRGDLSRMRGVPGYNVEAINKVLEEHALHGMANWTAQDSERLRLEGRDTKTDHGEIIECLEYWGSVPGRLLQEWGMSTVGDPNEEHAVTVWKIGTHIVRAVLNPDPLGKKPYAKASFNRRPGSFWGDGVPRLMRDLADVCNAAARSLVNNMAISSGPQVEMNIDRLAPGEEVTSMFPWKIWQTATGIAGDNRPAVQFFQPGSNASDLMAVFEKFSRLADDHTGIPAYTYGNPNVGGAGRTASGLSMLMGNASKGIKHVIGNLDRMIEDIVERCFFHNMRYEDDPSIKGDLKIVARGSENLLLKEQAMVRRNEFLQATANPIDIQIMGLPGRAEVLREVARGLDMDVDKIVPEMGPQMMPMMAAPGAPPPAPASLDAAGNPVNGRDAQTIPNNNF